MKGLRTSVFVVLATLVMVVAPPAVADHRSGHSHPGKPSPSPSPDSPGKPSPSPTPEPPKLVNVTLEVATNLQRTDDVQTRACDLVVLEGSDGLKILQAALDARCIRSFEVEQQDGWEGPASILRCLDDLCNSWYGAPEYEVAVGFYWSVGPQWNLLQGFASEGSVMTATYRDLYSTPVHCC